MNAEQMKPEDVLGPLNDVERRNASAFFYVAGIGRSSARTLPPTHDPREPTRQ